jgi:hypothetical protein
MRPFSFNTGLPVSASLHSALSQRGIPFVGSINDSFAAVIATSDVLGWAVISA